MPEQLHLDGFGKIPDSIPDTQLAWVAGIVDGEGCVSISYCSKGAKRAKTHSMQLIVNMTHEKTIKRLYDIFRVGCVGKQERSKIHKNQRDSYHWIASSNQAAEILKMIKPFMVTKLEEAEIAIEFQEGEKTKYMQGKTPQHIIDRRNELMQEIKSYKAKTGRKPSKTQDIISVNSN